MLALIILSVGLAMDAFAVSLVRGSTGERRVVHALELGLAFGLAQGLMPLIGWAAGALTGEWFRAFDHWIAFGLLSILGGKLLFEALSADEGEETSVGAHGRLLGLLTAAFATSIDAAAAGLTLPLLGQAVPVACLTIGATTAVLCTAGYLIGARASDRLGRGAEILGGLVLVALGIKILVEHLSA